MEYGIVDSLKIKANSRIQAVSEVKVSPWIFLSVQRETLDFEQKKRILLCGWGFGTMLELALKETKP